MTAVIPIYPYWGGLYDLVIHIYKMVGNPSGLTYHRLPATPGDASAPFRDSRHHRLGRISFGRKLPQKRRPSREPTLAASLQKYNL